MEITLENLKKTYSSGESSVTAVDGISLNIPSNTIFGIIGKSGAGKSSLVRLVSLLETPDQGSVFYGSQRVDNLSKKELIQKRRRIGMIFQNFNLFSSRSAAKNIAYPLELCKTPKAEIKKRVEEMLSLVGLSDKANAPVSTLSGGQKQRIAIARALATNPDILFCDEATSALDPQTTHSILDLIREIQKKMNLTVVMITHQMEVVRDACSLVAVIDSGRVVEQGTVSEIFAHPKSEITREFISRLTPSEEEDPCSQSMVKWGTNEGAYRLSFTQDTPDKPVISQISRKFNVDVNILSSGVQTLSDNNRIGIMTVDFMGDADEIQKAIDYLAENNVIVQKQEAN